MSHSEEPPEPDYSPPYKVARSYTDDDSTHLHYNSQETPSTSFTNVTSSGILWDSKNSEQQEILSSSARYSELLDGIGSDVIQRIKIDETMWAHLMQLGVICKQTDQEIPDGSTRGSKVEELLDYLRHRAVWQFHAFVRALSMTDQQDVIVLLGLDPAVYGGDMSPSPSQAMTDSAFPTQLPKRKTHDLNTPDGERRAISKFEIETKGLLKDIWSYRPMLLKKLPFGFVDYPIDVTPICINQSEKMSDDGKEPFEDSFGTSTSVLVRGRTGTGKSTILQIFLHERIYGRIKQLRLDQMTDPEGSVVFKGVEFMRTSDISRHFYRLCLMSLLTDARSVCEEDVATDFPYCNRQQKCTEMDHESNDCCHWTFPHLLIQEFLAAMYVIEGLSTDVKCKQAILLSLCSDPKMRNVVRLILNYISQFKPELLPDVTFIIRACLILQTEILWCDQPQFAQELLKLPAVIQETFPTNILTVGLTKEQSAKLDEIVNLIQNIFTEKSDCTVDSGWFANSSYTQNINSENLQRGQSSPPDTSGCFHVFLRDCLEQLPSEQREAVIDQTIVRAMQSSRTNPYHFFNQDCGTLTFLGFFGQGPILDVEDGQSQIQLNKEFVQSLSESYLHNGLNLSANFEGLSRVDQIKRLCMAIGTETPNDPNPGYILTADNIKKILAIQTRFRCNIPVVIMGETGCGKTKLIEFLCGLQCPPGVQNMLRMKVHPETTEEDLVTKVHEAQKLAELNKQQYPDMYTVLFLDEVNTSKALGLVEEIFCNQTLYRMALTTGSGLRLIAACNPYRKQSQLEIKRFEQFGLADHVGANQATDMEGYIPMHHLAYHVHPLPESLLPLVWDFGQQLRIDTEELYIQEIVRCKLKELKVSRAVISDHGARAIAQALQANHTLKELKFSAEDISDHGVGAITQVLLQANRSFMHNQKGEGSFVNLHVVSRVVDVIVWFYHQRGTLFTKMDELKASRLKADTTAKVPEAPSDVARALILALWVCYHTNLQKSQEFRNHVCELFKDDLKLPLGLITMEQEIQLCQDVFLNDIKLGPNITWTLELKDDVFMMIVCIELGIPLFMVEKPSSSRSLAKNIVMNAMQGPHSSSEVLKRLKKVNMVSYQCSELSTPDDISNLFRQSAHVQKEREGIEKFVVVVALDEIGLTEDSSQMPLKTLHRLLEDGPTGDDDQGEREITVGFIETSNWVLDLAKMNRGILLQQRPYNESEMEQTIELDVTETSEIRMTETRPVDNSIAENMLNERRERYAKAVKLDEELDSFLSRLRLSSGIDLEDQILKIFITEDKKQEVEQSVKAELKNVSKELHNFVQVVTTDTEFSIVRL